MATMKAVRIHEFGGPQRLALDHVPIPTPAADEVLVKVHAVSVNPVDLKTRAGQFPPVKREQLPFTLGRDVSGVIERCGDAVRGWKPGDAVFAMLDQSRGGYAEYVALAAALCAPKPSTLDHVQAAAVPLAALTAWQGLFDHGKLGAGQSVLIHGGAGGVGHFAIQLAKSRGARVSTTVASRDMEFASDLDADVAVDYTTQRFEDNLTPVDLVLDLIGGETQQRSWKLIKKGGALISTIAQPKPELASEHKARGALFFVEPNADQLRSIGQLIDAEQVRVQVSARFPLAQVGEAHQHLERTHTQGKVVLIVA
ncbi:MAG: NADP-dependent oxidoreductase [Polyangiales bacterium]